MKTYLKIKIPRSDSDLIAACLKLIKKHKAMGNSSPVTAWEMDTFETLAQQLKDLDELIESIRDTLGGLVQEKVNKIGRAPDQTVRTAGTLRFHFTSLRDILIGFHKGKERQLAEWGFGVVLHTGSATITQEEEEAGDVLIVNSNPVPGTIGGTSGGVAGAGSGSGAAPPGGTSGIGVNEDGVGGPV